MHMYYIEAKGETSLIFSVPQHTLMKGFYHRILFAEFFKNFHKSESSSLPLSPHFIFDVFPTFF